MNVTGKSRAVAELARRIRVHGLRMTSSGGSAHVGSVFSMADIVATLYGRVLRVRPEQPNWPDRDRFILSKGHAGAGIYAALAERGFFSTALLDQHYQNGSIFSGHVSHKNIAGVEISTGSLGHGLGIGCGMAYGARLQGRGHRVYVLLSDGECDEGSNWEAILFAGHHELGRLVVVIDYNRIQSLKSTDDTLTLEPFADKWRSFRWDVVEVNGHDHAALERALDHDPGAHAQPRCVIARTTKGKGVSFMENSVLWHYRTAKGLEFEEAMRQLEGE